MVRPWSHRNFVFRLQVDPFTPSSISVNTQTELGGDGKEANTYTIHGSNSKQQQFFFQQYHLYYHQYNDFPPSNHLFMILYDIIDYFLSKILSVSSIIIIFLQFQCSSHCPFFMSAIAESHAPKRLLAGYHVSGTFGELIPNPDPTKRQCCWSCEI